VDTDFSALERELRGENDSSETDEVQDSYGTYEDFGYGDDESRRLHARRAMQVQRATGLEREVAGADCIRHDRCNARVECRVQLVPGDDDDQRVGSRVGERTDGGFLESEVHNIRVIFAIF